MNIYDIAKKTDLSIATVSRVINNKGNVSEKTKQKVASAIGELNYIPNAMAQGLACNFSKTVAVLVPDAKSHFSVAISVLENKLESVGYDVMLYCTGKDQQDMDGYIKRAIYKKADAIILVGSLFADFFNGTNQNMLPPLILINGPDTDVGYNVICDEQRGMFDAVLDAYAEGKRRFAYVYDVDTLGGRRKREGFEYAIKHLKLPTTDYIVSKADTADKMDTVVADIKLSKTQIAFCSDDTCAALLMQHLHKADVAIPDDVCVVGFNNNALCGWLYPTLTSIDNRLPELCATAVDTLKDIFENKPREKVTKLSCKLIRRETF